jgi:hypothetical protein
MSEVNGREVLSDAEKLARIASWIDKFDTQTTDEGYTSVNDAWKLFDDISALAGGAS